MKKSIAAFCSVLFFCLLLSAAGIVRAEDQDTLADWNIRINVPDGATAVLQGSEYYIYAGQEGAIPYVMLKTYRYDDAQTFLSDFTKFMQEQYPDLEITSEAVEKTIGDKPCFEIDYSYEVSGYEVRDRRVVTIAGGTAYMFASKEIEALDMTIGSMLDDIVAESEFVSDNVVGESTGLSEGYLYCEEDGMPKYWLDFSETMADNLVLHCWFRSEGPEFREECFILDLSTADVTENGMKIRQIRDLNGADKSDQFGDLTIQLYLDGAVMNVECDEKTPVQDDGGPVPTGTYLMAPADVGTDGSGKQSYLCPEDDGPYQPEELCRWAQIYCLRETGIYLPEAEYNENPDNTFSVRLYASKDADKSNTAEESVRYTVDAYGEGKNDITGKPVSLMR